MNELIVKRGQRQVAPSPQPERRISGCQIAGITIGALFLGIVLSQVPDMIRYARMSSM
jgi:hypothetical protein